MMQKRKDRHVMEMLGKTRVVVEDGKVVEVGEPMTEYCPIFEKIRGISKFTQLTAKENAEFRIQDFGLFTEDRELEMEIFVGCGASETFMTGLRSGLIESCVTACDGAGTVITSNPKLTQGIGSRISGLVETSPIPGLIKRIQELGGIVLDPETAKLDQAGGVNRAIKLGHKKIGVTVAITQDAKKIREIEKQNPGVELTLFGVHTTGMSDEDAKELVNYVDMTTGCTSKWVRHHSAKKRILSQHGTSIPIYSFTQRGKNMLLERAKEIEDAVLITTEKLPQAPEHKQPRPLV
jgi:putative methanogenesis marker protein 8